jgi:hypothetical protein
MFPKKQMKKRTRQGGGDDAHGSKALRAFLKDYTVPFVQLDPMKTILVFSHDQNSFDKRKLLEGGQNPTFKESPKTVPMFIRTKDEKPILDFFLKDIYLMKWIVPHLNIISMGIRLPISQRYWRIDKAFKEALS